jgi:glycosyltransferase involved in cell wall biosynthesis
MERLSVAFDHEIFTRQKMGGISRYFFHLLTAFGKLPVDAQVYAPFHANEMLQLLPKKQVHGWDAGPDFYKYKGGFIYLNHVINRLQLLGKQPDVFHETYYAKYANLGSKRPIVITVHDFVHEKYPELFASSDNTTVLKQKAIARAQHIICISEHTKNDLLHHYPVAEEKISVIHHGTTPLPSGTGLATPAANKPYFLYVGGRMPYKNFGLLLRAFASNAQLYQHFELLAFGGGPFSREEMRQINDLGLGALVRQRQGNDAELQQAYAQAVALVYPSLYEGFGFPPLEAMHAACPVLLSNASCLPEISGEAALYFDPTQEESLVEAMLRITQDSELSNSLIALGKTHVLQYNWTDTAKKTLDSYRKII